MRMTGGVPQVATAQAPGTLWVLTGAVTTIAVVRLVHALMSLPPLFTIMVWQANSFPA